METPKPIAFPSIKIGGKMYDVKFGLSAVIRMEQDGTSMAALLEQLRRGLMAGSTTVKLLHAGTSHHSEFEGVGLLAFADRIEADMTDIAKTIADAFRKASPSLSAPTEMELVEGPEKPN